MSTAISTDLTTMFQGSAIDGHQWHPHPQGTGPTWRCPECSHCPGKARALLEAPGELLHASPNGGTALLRRRLLEGDAVARGGLWRELSTKIAWAIGTTCGLSYSGKRSGVRRLADRLATDVLDDPRQLLT